MKNWNQLIAMARTGWIFPCLSLLIFSAYFCYDVKVINSLQNGENPDMDTLLGVAICSMLASCLSWAVALAAVIVIIKVRAKRHVHPNIQTIELGRMLSKCSVDGQNMSIITETKEKR